MGNKSLLYVDIYDGVNACKKYSIFCKFYKNEVNKILQNIDPDNKDTKKYKRLEKLITYAVASEEDYYFVGEYGEDEYENADESSDYGYLENEIMNITSTENIDLEKIPANYYHIYVDKDLSEPISSLHSFEKEIKYRNYSKLIDVIINKGFKDKTISYGDYLYRVNNFIEEIYEH